MRTFHGRIGRIHCLAYSPDGTTLASGGRGGLIRLWDPLVGRSVGKFRRGDTKVGVLAYSPDGSMMASAPASDFGKAHVWSTKDGEDLGLFGGRGYAPVSLAFRPDNRALVASGFDGVTLWDLDSKKSLARLNCPRAWASDFSPDGTFVAIGSGEKAILFWDPVRHPNGRPIDHPESVKRWSIPQRPEPHRLRFSPDGRLLAATAGWSICLYDVKEGRRIAALKGHRQVVKSLDFSPDGRTLASASHDGTVRFWDVESGDEKACFDWKIGAVDCAVFAPDGMTIAVGGVGGVVVWDVE